MLKGLYKLANVFLILVLLWLSSRANAERLELLAFRHTSVNALKEAKNWSSSLNYSNALQLLGNSEDLVQLREAHKKLKWHKGYEVLWFGAGEFDIAGKQKTKKFYWQDRSIQGTLQITKVGKFFSVKLDSIYKGSKITKKAKIKDRETYYFDGLEYGVLLMISR